MNRNVLPDIEELEKLFYYDETSPSCLRWRINRYAGEFKSVLMASEGDKVGAWAKSPVTESGGSWNTTISRKKYKVHRIIYKMFYPDFDEALTIDHIDGNPMNNRIENLRAVTHKQNMRNIKKRKDNSSKITGVEFYQRPHRSDYFTAGWTDNNGKSVHKSFSVSVHGYEGALIKAIEARTKGLEDAGGYSESHGVRNPTLQRIIIEQYEEAINEN